MTKNYRDWRTFSPQHWYGKNQYRCRYCHPSPIPPFPDCPHGHYLTPARLDMQTHYERRTQIPWIIFLWLACVFWLKGDVIIDIIVSGIYALWLAILFGGWAIGGATARRLAKAGVAYDDYQSFLWEKRTKRNEPWRVRIYP